MNHNHCWHETGVVLTSNPPQYPEVCCHCGEQRVIRGAAVTPQEGHGKHAPTPMVVSLPVYTYETLPRFNNADSTKTD
jgi:hypothetical protein